MAHAERRGRKLWWILAAAGVLLVVIGVTLTFLAMTPKVLLTLRVDVDNADPALVEELKARGLSEREIAYYLCSQAASDVGRRLGDAGIPKAEVRVFPEEGLIKVAAFRWVNPQQIARLMPKRPSRKALLTVHLVATEKDTVDVKQKLLERFGNQLQGYKRRQGLFTNFRVAHENLETVRAAFDETAEVPGFLPEGTMLAFSRPYLFSQPHLTDQSLVHNVYLLVSEPFLNGDGINRVEVKLNRKVEGRYYHVQARLDSDGTRTLESVTSANVGGQIAVLIDGEMYHAVTIPNPFRYGHVFLGTRYSDSEAADLAAAICPASVPVTVVDPSTTE